MLKISAAGNTEIPCYLVLQEMGYDVTHAIMGDDESWIAKQKDTELIAESPCMLLGLATLAEQKGSYWRASDTAIASCLEQFYSDSE